MGSARSSTFISFHLKCSGNLRATIYRERSNVQHFISICGDQDRSAVGRVATFSYFCSSLIQIVQPLPWKLSLRSTKFNRFNAKVTKYWRRVIRYFSLATLAAGWSNARSLTYLEVRSQAKVQRMIFSKKNQWRFDRGFTLLANRKYTCLNLPCLKKRALISYTRSIWSIDSLKKCFDVRRLRQSSNFPI